MKRKRTQISAWILAFIIMVTTFLPLIQPEAYQAASSYTNAKEFYETCTSSEEYRAEAYGANVYYATKAKLASSSTNLKYYTVGFDITMNGNGKSVSFTVQRTGGSMSQVGNPVKSGDYEYNLYAIKRDKLYELATKVDSGNAAYVLSASNIDVYMNAIMVTKEGNNLNGGITENGSGGFTKWGKIYRLKDNSDLSALKDIFSGHTFASYKKIYIPLSNFSLSVRYNVLGLNPTGTTPTLASGYSMNSSGILLKSGSTYIQTSKVLQNITLLSYGTIGLSKTGYHLPGGNEWITDDSRMFSSGLSYSPNVVDPVCGTKNHGITLYANWKPNTYTITYNANGGSGSVAASKFTYDTAGNLRTNTFSRTGYYLPEGAEWNTKADGTGTSYSSAQAVSNLTTTNGATITLYANWKPCVLQITTDKQGGTDGTDSFFEKYGVGFYKESATANRITSITSPTKTGYDFLGYFGNIFGTGPLLVDADGDIVMPTTQFAQDATIYAGYEAKQFQIIFDKQGGAGGTNSAIATYDQLLPNAVAPVRTGYSFKGYFTKANGTGEMYYNEFMATDKIYQTEADTTLYAYWLDDTAPEVFLTANIDTWTNREIYLTASAYDYGAGLSSLQLYQDDVLVAEYTDLNGAVSKNITFQNVKEGAVTYKAVATDMSGRVTETYKTVYYDVVAPSGEFVEFIEEDGVFKIVVDVTDISG